MKRIVYATRFALVALVTIALACSCSSGDSDTGTTPQDAPKVIDITNAEIDISGNEPMFYFSIEEQEGGTALLTATETRAGTTEITGAYNKEKRGYEFDLSELEDNKQYTFKITVKDRENKVVIVSTEKQFTMPDLSDSATVNTEGESDGTRVSY